MQPPSQQETTSRHQRQSSLSLHIVVVGGGIGGLAAAYTMAKAGHRVTVLERKNELREIGAGIWLSPNGTRLLQKWGLGDALEEMGPLDHTQSMNTFIYTGELQESFPLGEEWEKEAGFPTYQVHRADLHKLLYDIASPVADVRFSCEVTKVDLSVPSVTLASGETIPADLIIGADGVNSAVRPSLGNPQVGESVGDSVYRFMIPMEEVRKDPDLAPIVEKASLNVWIGRKKHVVGYGIRNQTLWNVGVYVPETMPTLFDAKADPKVMRQAFEGEDWDPRVHKIFDLVKSKYLLKWHLLHSKPLDRLVHPDANLTLLGDAARILPPHYGQGTSMALEDAAVLGNLFSRIADRRQIRTLLRAYEEIRLPRNSATWLDSMERQQFVHFLNEKVKEALNGSQPQFMRNRKAHELTIPFDCTHDFGYDADAVTDDWWAKNIEQVEDE